MRVNSTIFEIFPYIWSVQIHAVDLKLVSRHVMNHNILILMTLYQYFQRVICMEYDCGVQCTPSTSWLQNKTSKTFKVE